MNKKVIWTKGHKLKKFVVSNTNLIGQLSYVKYYEDIIDPSLHVEISVLDPFGLINSVPIRSGASVTLSIEHPSQDFEMELIVTNIIGHVIDQKREVYTLVCESPGALSNHTNRVWKKYKGAIHTTVKTILQEKILGDISDENVHPTKNALEFYGNYRRPFKVISDLCRKSLPTTADGTSANKGTAGYIFFETQDGYNFKSIDKIFSGDAVGDPYIMTPFQAGLDPKNNFHLASAPNFKESHDIIKKLRSGQYSTANYYYNVLTRQVEFNNFKFNSKIEKANDEDVTPVTYKDAYSRIILGTLDQGTTNVNADGDYTDKPTPQEQAKYQAQASARYTTLFSQSLDITVPMNLSLRVGTLINLEFPDINIDDKTTKKSPESGNYMIARLSHEFGNPDGDFTGLTLVRDSFTTHE